MGTCLHHGERDSHHTSDKASFIVFPYKFLGVVANLPPAIDLLPFPCALMSAAKASAHKTTDNSSTSTTQMFACGSWNFFR